MFDKLNIPIFDPSVCGIFKHVRVFVFEVQDTIFLPGLVNL